MSNVPLSWPHPTSSRRTLELGCTRDKTFQINNSQLSNLIFSFEVGQRILYKVERCVPGSVAIGLLVSWYEWPIGQVLWPCKGEY